MALDPFKLHKLHPTNVFNISRHLSGKTLFAPVVRCSATTKICASAIQRPSANYQPTSWNYTYLQSFKNDNADELYKEKAMNIEGQVRCMINDDKQEMLTTLEMIDDIQRLGLAYRFKDAIQAALDRFISLGGLNAMVEKSLHATALSFRLLRQHGYEVSADAFKKFMDDKGDIKASVREDVKGILSFYEAAFLLTERDYSSDKLMAQTCMHLKSLEENTDSGFAEMISHALELPLHRRMIMLEARWYIETYNQREDANQMLLELAKLDFNMLQSVLRRDLKQVSKWWNDLGLASKLTFSRDRLMECFFWTVGMVSEPQFNSFRRGLTKVTSMITTIDDVYDVFGTLDELELFTDAVRRWDINALKDLPGYMKLSFLALYNTINEMAYDNLKERGEDILPYLRNGWADLCETFLQESRWSHNKCMPSFEDYLENGWRSVSGPVILLHTYFLLDQNISKHSLDCLEDYHELLRWPSIVFRLSNDLVTSSAELARGEVVNSMSCYMNETGVSDSEARERIKKLIDEAWKKMNELQIDDNTPFAKPFVGAAINLARIAQCTYQHGDGHGAPDSRSKRRIISLIIEHISIT